nr:MAG TPA: hypothetical protein [Caudoviricetes sp.]
MHGISSNPSKFLTQAASSEAASIKNLICSLTTRKRSNRPSGRQKPIARHGKAWGKSNKRLQVKAAEKIRA